MILLVNHGVLARLFQLPKHRARAFNLKQKPQATLPTSDYGRIGAIVTMMNRASSSAFFNLPWIDDATRTIRDSVEASTE